MPTTIPIKDANGSTVSMVVNPAYDPQDDMVKMKSVQKKWRDSFTVATTALWDITSANGATATATAGVLTVDSGTNSGGWVEMLSKETFTIPMRVMFAPQITTRRANTMQFIEIVSVDPVTGKPDERNRVSWSIGGAVDTVATVARYEVQNGGVRPLVSANETIATTASYSVMEIEPFADEAWLHQRAIDAHATGRSFSRVRHQQIPDPNALYKIRIRSINCANWAATTITNATDSGGLIQITTSGAHSLANGAVVWIDSLVGVTDANNTDSGGVVRGFYTIGNAAGTTFTLNGSAFGGTYLSGSGRYAVAAAPTGGAAQLTFQFIHCQDYAELTAEITASRGSNVVGQSMPVILAGATAASTAIGQAQVIGAVAHDAARGSTAPVINAARALSANYTTVATGDVADLITTLQGILITRPWQIPEQEWSYVGDAAGITTTADVTLAGAAGAGLRRYLTSIQLSNDSATATDFLIKDGATNPLWRVRLPANCPNFSVEFANPLRSPANATLVVACSATGKVHLNAQGYTAP